MWLVKIDDEVLAWYGVRCRYFGCGPYNATATQSFHALVKLKMFNSTFILFGAGLPRLSWTGGQ